MEKQVDQDRSAKRGRKQLDLGIRTPGTGTLGIISDCAAEGQIISPLGPCSAPHFSFPIHVVIAGEQRLWVLQRWINVRRSELAQTHIRALLWQLKSKGRTGSLIFGVGGITTNTPAHVLPGNSVTRQTRGHFGSHSSPSPRQAPALPLLELETALLKAASRAHLSAQLN